MSTTRSRRQFTVIVAAVLAVAAGVAGCGSTDSGSSAKSPSNASSSASIAGKKVAFVGVGDMNPWSKANNHTVIDALTAKGVKVTYLQDPFDVQTEVQNLNRAVASKPDLIMLLALNYQAVAPSVARAKAANIPVINLSSPTGVTAPNITASVEGNHAELGKFAARNIIEGLRKEGVSKGNVIAITGTTGLTQVDARMRAFKTELATAPGLKLVAVEDGNWDQATSQKIAAQLFAKYRSQGGIQAAYGMADNQAIGIIAAAKQAGLPVGVAKKGLIVTGSNCFQVGLDAIKSGELYGSATQSPFVEGAFAAEQAIKFLQGEHLEAVSYADETRITADNVGKIAAKKLCP